MANDCTENKTLSKDCVEVMHTIPVLRYLKDPVVHIEDLYLKYPQGGEYGWYAFVMTLKTFAYWNVCEKKWKTLSVGELQEILGIDSGLLEEGDVPIWDAESGKFIIKNLFEYMNTSVSEPILDSDFFK